MSDPSVTESFEVNLSNGSTALLPDLVRQLRVFQALSSIIDYAYTFDSEGRFLYSNQALLDLLGLELNQVVGKTFFELPYPRDLASKLHAQIQQVLDTGQRVVDETPYISPSGLQGYYEYIFNPVFGSNGMVEVVAGSTREISHRRLYEEAQGHLAAIVDSSDDAIVSKDLTGIVTTWNMAAHRIFGYTAKEMVGTSILRLIPPHLHHEEEIILRKIKADERIEQYETTRIRKDGQTIEVSLTISPIRNSAHQVIGTSKIARDISATKHMERMLIQSETIATMNRMAATVAHEINNPLAAVINLVYLAKGACPNDHDAVGYLTSAEQELERIAHIARQTLGYYRDSGAHSAVACQDLLPEVIRAYQSKINNRHIAVEIVCDTLPLVTASRGELTQVFSNLIANAVDAMPNGGRLRIHASELNSENLQVVVQDQGTGISRDDLPRVFDPFFTTKGNLGTGIGLWVTRQLLERHHGHIDISTSTLPPNNGTTVRITIPFQPGSAIAECRTGLSA